MLAKDGQLIPEPVGVCRGLVGQMVQDAPQGDVVGDEAARFADMVERGLG